MKDLLLLVGRQSQAKCGWRSVQSNSPSPTTHSLCSLCQIPIPQRVCFSSVKQRAHVSDGAGGCRLSTSLEGRVGFGLIGDSRRCGRDDGHNLSLVECPTRRSSGHGFTWGATQARGTALSQERRERRRASGQSHSTPD